MLWVLIRSASQGATNEYLQDMFLWRNKTYFYLIRHLYRSMKIDINNVSIPRYLGCF